MRILILNADYPKFLADLYLSNPGLHEASYTDQLVARNRSLFGVANFYSRNFQRHGHAATEIHLNNPWLQHAWARENGLNLPPPPPPQPSPKSSATPRRDSDGWGASIRPAAKNLLRPFLHFVRRGLSRNDALTQIFYAQVESFDANVILNQELAYWRSPILKRIKRPGRLVIGQIASGLPEIEDYRIYDCVISSLPNLVSFFRGQGVRSELNRLAFEPSILSMLGSQPDRDIALSFVGSLSPEHRGRVAFLEHLARFTPLQIWGNGVERLPVSSPIHARYRGEAWGRRMYEVLRRSRITLNHHIDLAEDWANNMRLYEATGVGALLLTDAKRNLHEIYAPGKQVAVYADAEDCVLQVNGLLVDDRRRAEIAAEGQQHCLESHNYFGRTGEIGKLCASLLG